MSNTKIVLNRQSDLILDNAQITKPQGIVLTDIAGVSEAVASINTATSLGMSAEASSRVAGDVSVTAAMSAEISTRVVAETSLQNNVDAEASLRVVGDQAEESRAIFAEGSLAADLAAEQSRAEDAEASLNAKVENVISNIDPAALDSLTEIVGAFQSADGDINNAITNLSNTATSNLSAEASVRLAADQSLAGELSSEVADREAAVSLEEAARISGDASLALDLSAEVEARISDVNAEGAARTSDVDALYADYTEKINAEHSHHIAGDVSLAAALSDAIAQEVYDRNLQKNAEESLRIAVDASLAAGLSTEVATRTSADASLFQRLHNDIDDAITSEESQRIAGDASVTANLSTEVAARTSADASLATLVDDESGYRNIADQSIVADLSAETSRAESAEAVLTADLDAEITARGNAVTAEASARLKGDLDLKDRIATEEAARAEADASLESYANDIVNTEIQDRLGALSIERAARISGDASLAANLSAQISEEHAHHIAGDLSLASDLADETESRVAAVSTEASQRVAGDVSLQNQIDFITSNVDPAAIDSLTEIVGAFQSADGDINNAITTLADAAGASLSAEVARATSVETEISNETTFLKDVYIPAEISDRIVAIENEASIRLAADAMEADMRLVADELLDAAKLDLAGGTMTGYLHMGGHGINQISAISATEGYMDSFNVDTLMSNQGNSINVSTPLNFGGNIQINNLPAPFDGADAANKNYVDNAKSSLESALSTEESTRLAAESSIAAELSSDIEALADVDGTTIVLNGDTNQIELKESVAAPASGIRTLMGEVDIETILKVGGVDVMAAIASGDASLEVALSTEVSYLIANTDLTSIDSFAEIVSDLSSEVVRAESVEATKLDLAGGTMTGDINMGRNSLNFVDGIKNAVDGNPVPVGFTSGINAAEVRIINVGTPIEDLDATNKIYVDSNISAEVSRAQSAELQINQNIESVATTYYQKLALTGDVDGTNVQFDFAVAIYNNSESIYLNGLLLTAGEDYTTDNVSVIFINAPQVGDRVKAYGVSGPNA